MWWKQQGGQELRRLLMEAWDPIGVRDFPEAASEYDGYRGPIVQFLRENASAEQLAEYLSRAQDGMGPPTDPKLLLPVAERLLRWYPDSLTRWSTARRSTDF